MLDTVAEKWVGLRPRFIRMNRGLYIYVWVWISFRLFCFTFFSFFPLQNTRQEWNFLSFFSRNVTITHQRSFPPPLLTCTSPSSITFNLWSTVEMARPSSWLPPLTHPVHFSCRFSFSQIFDLFSCQFQIHNNFPLNSYRICRKKDFTTSTKGFYPWWIVHVFFSSNIKRPSVYFYFPE